MTDLDETTLPNSNNSLLDENIIYHLAVAICKIRILKSGKISNKKEKK